MNFMGTTSNHGGLLSFEPTRALNKWGFISKSWNNRNYPPFFHPESIEELMLNWETGPNDIFICTHQKVGTHLTKKYVVELLRHCRLHGPEHGISTGDIGHGTVSWPEVYVSQHGKEAFYKKLASDYNVPRLWYTHCSVHDLPFKSVHQKTKFIHVFRDPRGAVVSQYHFYRSHPMLGVSQDLDLDTFIDLFLEGSLYFGDYFRHTTEWSFYSNGSIAPENILSLRYEDLVDNKRESLEKIAGFLFPELVLDDESVNSIIESTEFNTMKKEISNNPQSFHFNPDKFFREGKSLGWRDTLSYEQQDRICSVAKEKWGAHSGEFMALV